MGVARRGDTMLMSSHWPKASSKEGSDAERR